MNHLSLFIIIYLLLFMCINPLSQVKYNMYLEFCNAINWYLLVYP